MANWKRVRKGVGWTSAVFLIASIIIGLKWGLWEGFDPAKRYKILEAGILGFWILVPPIWFWGEYFFLYKDKASSSVDLEAFKHGQDQSAKIWLALVTLLAGLYFGKDLIREISPAQGTQQSEQGDQAVQEAYKAYIQAWKTKDIAALQLIIADDYMAVNFENKVSSKEIEIATAKSDPVWNEMMVDEIHTHVVGGTAVASGLISAQGQRADGNVFNAKARFLAVLVKRDGRWQLLATESAPARQQAQQKTDANSAQEKH